MGWGSPFGDLEEIMDGHDHLAPGVVVARLMTQSQRKSS